MTGFIDFETLKEQVDIEHVTHLLDLNLKTSGKQLRGPCPACNAGGDRALVVTPDKSVFYCFSAQKGGDLISLAAHILDMGMKDAAQYIHNSLSTVPQEKEAKETKEKLQPLQHIEADHPAVIALGLDISVAESMGIGYASKGIARGNVVIPVRDGNGTLHGYLGVQEITFIPKDFQTPDNVVPLKRKA